MRRARKVRDAMNQANPVYPELTEDDAVDLAPAENLVVPDKVKGRDHPAYAGYEMAVAKRKRKEKKYDTPPLKTGYKW